MGVLARGTVIEVEIASVWTAIPKVNDIAPNSDREDVDDSALDSGADNEYLPGMRDGDCSFTLNYDRTNTVHAYLEDSHKSDDDVENFRITQKDGETETFAAYVKTFGKTFARGDVQKASVTLKKTSTTTLS